MAISIKDEDLHDQIKQLSSELGIKQVDVIRLGVDRLRAETEAESRARRAMVAVNAIHDSIPAGVILSDDDLYDEDGLPA